MAGVSGTLKASVKAVMPDGAVQWIATRRAHERRRREHLEVYTPPSRIDLAPLEHLRAEPLRTLGDRAALEAFLPTLGLNAEVLETFPDELIDHTGRGLLFWQYPNQFAPYLIALSRHEIRSYLEIGTRHGGTFALTVEYLRRFNPIDRAVGIDIQPAAGLDAYAQATPGVEAVYADSRSRRVRTIAESGWDLALIDGDHSEAGCREDYRLLRDHARILAFHDIVNELVPGVGVVWREVKEELAATHDLLEFTAQYPDVVDRVGHPVLGLGVAIRR